MTISITDIIRSLEFIKANYKSLSDEINNLLEIGVAEYLQTQTKKYYHTSTFLYYREKVVFDTIYYPLKATYKEFSTDFKDLEVAFEEYRNITLVGMAGQGKTTLLRYIFLNAVRTQYPKIPLLIELRHLNDYPQDIENFIAEKALKLQLKPSEDTFKRALKTGSFLFLFDGFDEIHSDKKQAIIRQIELFTDAYPQNNVVITTRQGSGIECFPKFYDFQVNNLTKEDIKGFIKQMVTEEERQERLLGLVKNTQYAAYFENPLLLSMFIMSVEQHPEIPSKASIFYRNVFDTLYQRHDGITKNGFPRPKKTGLQREDFEDILSKFCYMSYKQERYSFTEEYLTDMLNKIKKDKHTCKTEDLIYDLQTNISILIKEGLEYQFPHRSMQEYFAALFVSKLPKEQKIKAYEYYLIMNIIDYNLIEHTDSLGSRILNISLKATLNHYNFLNLCSKIDENFKNYWTLPALKMQVEYFNQEMKNLIYITENHLWNKEIIAEKFPKNPYSDNSLILSFLGILPDCKESDIHIERIYYGDEYVQPAEIEKTFQYLIKEIKTKIQELEQELAKKEHEYDDFL